MAHNKSESVKELPARSTPAARAHAGAGLDTSESGPPRLHAPPGKPRPVESGRARLHSPAGAARQTARSTQLARPPVGAGVDSRESGPPRLQQRLTR
jgi:hypothetical protein